MFYRPISVALAGLFVWFVMRLAAPIVIVSPLRWNTIFLVGAGYASFIIGCLIADPRWGRSIDQDFANRRAWPQPLPQRTFWFTLAFGVFGMVIRVLDRVILRGVDYSARSDELRESLTNSDVSILGVVSSVVTPFCFIPLIILLASNRAEATRTRWVMAISVFTLPMLESFAQASRSVMLMTAAMFFISFSLLRFNGKLFNKKIFLSGFAGALLLTILSTVIFTNRLEDYGRNLDESVYSSVYATAFQPNLDAQLGLQSSSQAIQSYYRNILPNSMYYLSGIYEFDYSINRHDTQYFAGGVYIFYPYFKIISSILDINLDVDDDSLSMVYRTGVFTSFFGPIWVDFGYGMLFFVGFFGFIVQKGAVQASAGNYIIMPLYILGLVFVFFMPVFNLFSSVGFFITNAFIAFAVAVKMTDRRAA